MRNTKKYIIDLTQDEIDDLILEMPLHCDLVFCYSFGIDYLGEPVEKPMSLKEIAEKLELNIEVVKYLYNMTIKMLRHPHRGIAVVGDYKGQFIELGKKLREDLKKRPKICCICGERFIGYGNNPSPIKEEGYCCDKCNREKVIPMTIGSPIFKKYEVGMKVHILKMDGEVDYTNKVGVITLIDDAGQLHGTWGGCALIPFVDEFEIIEN